MSETQPPTTENDDQAPASEPARVVRRRLGKELLAMHTIDELLGDLPDQATQFRVLAWITSKYLNSGSFICVQPTPAGGGQ